MKANELRIKNLVTLNEKQRKELWENQINAQNDFFEVKTIYSDNDISIELDDEIIDISENDVDPIPLTEEWLLKFGFVWKNHGLRKSSFCVRQYGSGWSIFMSNESFNFNIELKYVHQLQNIYFALTQEELKIK